jgi:hypothetical protein
MPRNRKKPKTVEQHTFLGVKVDQYQVRSSTELNLILRAGSPWDEDPDAPVYSASTYIELLGTCIYPETRVAETYQLCIYGKEPTKPVIKISALHERGEDGLLKYREYRGVSLPVYRRPQGLAKLDRRRGSGEFTMAVFASHLIVTDWLVLLASGRTLYVAIHEMKSGRDRWAQSVSLQTTDPATE